MGFLKTSAIKAVTKKRTKQLLGLLILEVEKDAKEVIKNNDEGMNELFLSILTEHISIRENNRGFIVTQDHIDNATDWRHLLYAIVCQGD